MTAGKALPERHPTPMPCGMCAGPKVHLVAAPDILACKVCDRMDVWPTGRVSGG